MAGELAEMIAAKAHWQAGRLADAEAAARIALAREPDHPEALLLVGIMTLQRGDAPGAIPLLTKSASQNPANPVAQISLAQAYTKLKRYEESIACYRSALAMNPDMHLAWLSLAAALMEVNRPAEVVPAAQRAVAHLPDSWPAHLILGAALCKLERYADAMTPLSRCIALNPAEARGHYYLGLSHLLWSRGLDQALLHLREARKLAPDYSDTYLPLGAAFSELGLIDEGIEAFRAGALRRPDAADIASNLIFSLHFRERENPAEILAETRAWAAKFEAPLLRDVAPHANTREPDRRLRIGYISPDFRNHCQRLFTIPLLANHDREQFEIFCYSVSPIVDRFTDQIHQLAHHWRALAANDHDGTAQRVREDRIDILVDLSMHMSNNQLLVLARKPAPVQVTWLAYPGTTGLATIDYRLSDPQLDPAGTEAGKYSEETILLPDTFWCFDPQSAEQSDEAVSALPADTTGHMTFGCLNGFHKLNARGVALWSTVLSALPMSRLILLVPAGSARQTVLDRFAAHGIERQRIEMVGFLPRDEYLRTYRRIDIALDTIPYNGHTTSLDALWSGVPVVTRVGESVVGRAGLSQLTNLSLTELVAQTDEDFVRIVTELAVDRDRLRELRRTLRARMQQSPLMDARRFARAIENAYRTVWKRYCAKK